MTELMIRCPKTGKPVPTGMDLPIEEVKSGAIELEDNTFGPCPECGEMHTWSAKDVL